MNVSVSKEIKMDIVAFYSGQEPDYKGRTLSDILSFSNRELERCHDYIQILFPLKEPSNFNLYAPLLTDDIVNSFLNSEGLRANLLKSFDRMLSFYGFKREGSYVLVINQNFHWLSPKNHNFLRISRVLNCLSILGCRSYARALFDCLLRCEENGWISEGIISPTTWTFWAKAIEEGLDVD